MEIAVVAGLGNPGSEYAATRHNVGFRVIETLRRRRGTPWRRLGACAVAATVGAPPLILVRPEAYMNRSGAALAPLLEVVGAPAAELLVVVDDVDLPVGRLRLRRSGGPGTHNGLRDLVARLGTGFPRLRVGVGGGGIEGDLAEFVLSPFPESEREVVAAAVDRAADAVEYAVEHGLAEAMNRFNRPPSD